MGLYQRPDSDVYWISYNGSDGASRWIPKVQTRLPRHYARDGDRSKSVVSDVGRDHLRDCLPSGARSSHLRSASSTAFWSALAASDSHGALPRGVTGLLSLQPGWSTRQRVRRAPT